jgi:hypothetical protein
MTGREIYNLNQKVFNKQFELNNVPKIEDRDKVALKKVIEQQEKKDGGNYFKYVKSADNDL